MAPTNTLFDWYSNYFLSSVDYSGSCHEYAQKTEEELFRSDMLVLNGNGCQLSVSKGALLVRNGRVSGEGVSSARYYRGVHTLKQIVVLSSSGNISLDALHWCKEQSISLVLLDRDGHLLFSLTPEPAMNANLRRRQYRAYDSDRRVCIAREIVRQKIVSQIEVVRALPKRKRDWNAAAAIFGRRVLLNDSMGRVLVESVSSALDGALFNLEHMSDIVDMRMLEGRASIVYWSAFVGFPIKWQSKDRSFVPPHWRAVTKRTSPISSNDTGQNAINPFHAALNYLYTVTEHQLLGAIHIEGLDPACGFLHNELVYDLIEPLRAKIDEKALRLFQELTWKRGDVIPTKNGQFFFNAEVARYLVARGKLEESAITEVVTSFKKYLIDS